MVSSEAGSASPGIAVDREGHYYVGHDILGSTPPAGIAKLQSLSEEEPGEVLIQSLDYEESSAVAVDNSTNPGDPSHGDVFVDNVNSIAVFGPNGKELERFGSSADPEKKVPALLEGSGVAVNSALGKVYVADAQR